MLGLAVIGAAWLVIGAAGGDGKATAGAQVHANAPAAERLRAAAAAEQDARAGRPARGGRGRRPPTPPVPDDPGLDADTPAPTRAASNGGRRPTGVLGEASGAGVNHAYALSNGVALPPLEAPEEVKQIIEAGNAIARTPYKWGGGHGKLEGHGLRLLGLRLVRAGLRGPARRAARLRPADVLGQGGPGKWVTIYANAGHVYLVVAGIRFDTSAAKVTGRAGRTRCATTSGFVARHPAGL